MSSPAAVVRTTPLEIRLDESVPVLVIPNDMDLETLRAWVRDRLPEQTGTIAGRSSRLDLGQRDINLFDLRRLVHLLRHEFSIDITGLYVRPDAITRFAERELKLKLFAVSRPFKSAEDPDDLPTEELMGALNSLNAEAEAVLAPLPPRPVAEPVSSFTPRPPPPVDEPVALSEPVAALSRVTIPHDLQPADLQQAPAAPPAISMPSPSSPPSLAALPSPREGRRTEMINRTLRSGAAVRHDGDLFIFGDVNPGAHVVATGNIVVLGALKGMAHAGAGGGDGSFILAFDLRPTQLRIGRKIAIPPAKNSGGPFLPEIATVSEDQVVIEAYRGRLPRP